MSDTIQPAAGAPAVTEAEVERAVHEAFAAGGEGATAKPDYPGIVAAWINASVHNTPIAQNADAYSYLVSTAVPALIQRLEAA
jgi:Xaa-Pro aminopeptidase